MTEASNCSALRRRVVLGHLATAAFAGGPRAQAFSTRPLKRSAGVDAPASAGPAALAETVRRDIPRYAQAAKAAGLQPV